MLEQPARVAGPVVEVGGRAERGHAAHRRVSRRPAQIASAPPVPNPASHTPVSACCSLEVVDGGEQVVQPPAEREVALRAAAAPRNENVSTAHPISVAMRSASSGNSVCSDLAVRRADRRELPWQSTSPGSGCCVRLPADGTARGCRATRHAVGLEA